LITFAPSVIRRRTATNIPSAPSAIPETFPVAGSSRRAVRTAIAAVSAGVCAPAAVA
jgi:hypothetical protein